MENDLLRCAKMDFWYIDRLMPRRPGPVVKESRAGRKGRVVDRLCICVLVDAGQGDYNVVV